MVISGLSFQRTRDQKCSFSAELGRKPSSPQSFCTRGKDWCKLRKSLGCVKEEFLFRYISRNGNCCLTKRHLFALVQSLPCNCFNHRWWIRKQSRAISKKDTCQRKPTNSPITEDDFWKHHMQIEIQNNTSRRRLWKLFCTVPSLLKCILDSF